jgi:rfaE bifunctional protein kinase chain/domain
MKMEKTSPLALVNNFRNKKILVIGDSILDKSVFGTALGLSLESPTLKGKKEKIEYSFGGAANVVENILELGAKCTFITLLGDDPESFAYNEFERNYLELIPIKESGRLVTVKERHWMTKGAMYKVLQWDQLDNREISQDSINKLLKILDEKIKNFDMILLVDYRHGMMSKNLIDKIIEFSKKNKKPVIASSQVSESKSNHMDYSGADLIVMNKKEAECIDKNFSENNPINLCNITKSNVCITLGNKGSLVCFEGKKYFKEPIEINETDSCGAGDSFLAALSVSGLENIDASLTIANIWAGLSVMICGAKPPKKQELINYLNNLNN